MTNRPERRLHADETHGARGARRDEASRKTAAAYAAVVAPATGPDDALSSMLWKSRISEYIICIQDGWVTRRAPANPRA